MTDDGLRAEKIVFFHLTKRGWRFPTALHLCATPENPLTSRNKIGAVVSEDCSGEGNSKHPFCEVCGWWDTCQHNPDWFVIWPSALFIVSISLSVYWRHQSLLWNLQSIQLNRRINQLLSHKHQFTTLIWRRSLSNNQQAFQLRIHQNRNQLKVSHFQ